MSGEWPPAPLEQRYETLVSEYLRLRTEYAHVKDILRVFYGAPLSLSTVQPVLDLAAAIVAEDVVGVSLSDDRRI